MELTRFRGRGTAFASRHGWVLRFIADRRAVLVGATIRQPSTFSSYTQPSWWNGLAIRVGCIRSTVGKSEGATDPVYRAQLLTPSLPFGTLVWMATAYLDVPIYSELDDCVLRRASAQIALEEAQALRDAMRRSQILVRPSIVVLEELLCELDSDRPAMVRKLRIMRDLGNGFQGMLKQPSDLLDESIQTYAEGRPQADILLAEDQRRIVVKSLAEICAGSASQDTVLREIAAGVPARKIAWKETMRTAQAQVLAEVDRDKRDPRAITFEMFHKAGAQALAEDFAESLGCADACRRRGLDGLLAVPAVQIGIGVAMSQIYAEVVGEAGQPGVRLPHRNDGYDVWHAILGSTAEIFVTFDRRLAGHLERIPGLAHPRVVRSVTELLRLI